VNTNVNFIVYCVSDFVEVIIHNVFIRTGTMK
jgi:hypothetical protein